MTRDDDAPGAQAFSTHTCLLFSFSVALDFYTNKQTILQIFIPQAFVAIATSSGGIQTSIDKDINRDVKITTIESESYT